MQRSHCFVIFLLAVCAAAAAGLANDLHTLNFTAPAAADPTVKPLLGVIAGPDPAAQRNPSATAVNLTAQYQAVGIDSVRNNDYFDDRLDMEQIFNCGGPTYPSWTGCDATDDRFYNWTLSDRQFRSWLDGGFDPFLRLGNETACGCRARDFNGPQNAAQEDNWVIAANRVVERYDNWQGASHVLTYVDIWTEWPNEGFYDQPLENFPVFWVKALQALQAAHPAIKFGGPGLLAGSTNPPTLDFLTYLYQHNAKPAWIGYHVFSADPADFVTESRNYRELLDGTGQFSSVPWAGSGFFAGVELICDAYFQGTHLRDANGRSRSMTRGEQDQFNNHQTGAARNAAAWIALQYGDVERAYYYRGDDGASQPGADPGVPNSPLGGPGLFYGDATGTPKPKANAFRFFSRLYRDFPTLLANGALPSSAGSTEVWALGAESADGATKAALISNPNDAAVDLTLQFRGVTATPATFAHADVYTVDDSHDGTAAVAWITGALTVPANTIELVVFRSTDAAPGPLSLTSDASFMGSTVAPGSIVAAYGSNLATAQESAPSTTLPTTLGGASVAIKDSTGATRDAGLYFVSAGQVNLLIPDQTAAGPATASLSANGMVAAAGAVTIAPVAPGLFSAAGNGQGAAVAAAVHGHADGTQSTEIVASYDAQNSRWNPVPIDLGPAGEQVYLVLYGTGIRHAAQVTVTIGGQPASVAYFGAHTVYPGLDQVNVLLPRSLVGRGLVTVQLTADGIAANPVQIAVK